MTNIQKAASEFRKALAHADKAQSAPRSFIEVIEKGEALIEALEMAKNVPAATACADHEAGETGHVTFKTRVAHGSELFLAPPAQREAEPVAVYNEKQIAWELERTALGDGFYGNALRVAKDLPGVTADDRALLDRFATGMNRSTDHVGLQDLAMRIYHAPSHRPAETQPATAPADVQRDAEF